MKEWKNYFVCFLVLAVFDTFLLITVVGIKGIPLLADTSSHIQFFTAAHPIMNISWITSIYLTILLTLERYNTIVIRGRVKNETSRKKIGLSILVIILVVVAYNVPKCLEYTLKSIEVRTDYDLQNRNWTNLVRNLPERFRINMNDLDFFNNPNYQDMMETGGAHKCELKD